MVLIKKKYSLFFLFILINQIKFFSSIGVDGNLKSDIKDSDKKQNSKEENDLSNEESEKGEEEENKNEETQKGEEEEEENIKEETQKGEEIIETQKGEEIIVTQKREEIIETQKGEEDPKNESQSISKINSTEDNSPFDSYDACENIQPTYGIREDCISYSKIFDEKKCCYMTINYKYNEFNLCIRIAQDKDEIKKKIKDIEEEYEGCESVNIDCHSNYIELAKYSLLFLLLFVL